MDASGSPLPSYTYRPIEFLRLIVLDNSDYLPGSTDLLRRAGLIEIDLNGFGPCNDYAWTTSLFLTRDYAFQSFQPIGGRQPHPPVGGLGYNWEPRLERLLKQRPDLPLPQGDWGRPLPNTS